MITESSNMTRVRFLDGKKLFKAQPAQIIRLEAESNYTKVYFTNHAPLTMAKVLRKYEALLRPYGFLRTHRSHLVNALHVDEVDQNGMLRMIDASCVEVSRRKKREVYSACMSA